MASIPQHRSIRELEVQLDLAIASDAQTQKLFERSVISTAEREIARGKVLLVKAMLEGLDDELADDLARLNLEVKKKKAELDQAIAQMEVAKSVVARNQRLNERKAGMVATTSLWPRARGRLRACEAHAEVKESGDRGSRITSAAIGTPTITRSRK